MCLPVRRPVDRVLAVLPVRRAEPHGDLDVALTVPGYFPHAQPLVEGLSAAVDGQHVQDQVLAVPGRLVSEGPDETGAGAVALVTGG